MSVKQIPINIIQFDGDPELLKSFFDQIRSVAEINKYSQKRTIVVLKGKLIGPAQKLFAKNPELQKINDLGTLEKGFAAFFSAPSKCVASVELSSLSLIKASGNYKKFSTSLKCVNCDGVVRHN